MKFRFAIALLIAVCAGINPFAQSLAAPPEVSNIQVQQQAGSYLVDITYDLFDPDGDAMYVSVMFAINGNWSFGVPCRAVTGDVGFGGYSGTGKTIVWDALEDYPDFQGDDCRIRIFATDISPFPELNFFRIVELDTFPLSWDNPDTVGFGRSMHLMWNGEAPIVEGLTPEFVATMDTVYPYYDGLTGCKWMVMDGDCDPEFEDCWHPRLFNEATGDSFSYFAEINQLIFSNNGSGTSYFQRLLPSGPFEMKINTKDIAGTEVLPYMQNISFVVNYDPETIILNGQSDWDHPEDPEVYPYYILLNDPGQTHYPFQEGDRIPDRTYVVFKALFRDDPRDMVLDPGYEMGVTGNATGVINLFTGGQFAFNTGASHVDTDPAWDEGFLGFYADTLGFMPLPNTEFTFNMVGVDEHGRQDGTPAELSFTVGYPPCLQCLEILPGPYQASAFLPNLDCYEPDAGSHPCFGDTSVFFIKSDSTPATTGRTYMQQQGLMYLAIHKETGEVLYTIDQPSSEEYYVFPSKVYRMAVLMHGRDDLREAWTDPYLRSLAWRYQVDYDCDPENSIADGGGFDDLQQVTWGAENWNTPGLEITPEDGVWKILVDVVVPDQLLNVGPETFRMIIQFGMAGGDIELTEELFNKCIRQFSTGTVQGVNLDQTDCAFFPLRPAKYHVFEDVRPPGSGPGAGTWRDCNPSFPDVVSSLDLSLTAMASLDDQPVEQQFQIIFQAADGDLSCEPDLYTGRLALPSWHGRTD
jgi:hypothetical protein